MPSARGLAARCAGARASPRGLTVATAESCTGGLVAHAITANAGSSGYFVGGVVSYSNEAKTDAAGRPDELIDEHGAVSAQVAVRWRRRPRARSARTSAVAVPGSPGPDGGTAEKPVGLVYIAVADRARRATSDGSWDRRPRGEHRGQRGARRSTLARRVGDRLARRRRDAHRGRDRARASRPPGPARPIRPGTRIHVLGVGGAASAGAALHAARRRARS